ncbi:hypothetical protein SLS62_002386 [Diatrype stigma]|uniref:Leucine-rich repeat-containing protein 40 n=1 Tax=Diatrype stigma TaxID=117547 RepID=A0AAN9UY44_9PEZI
MDHDSRRPATAIATAVHNKSSGIPRPSTTSSSRLPVPQPRSSLIATTPSSSQSATLPPRRLRPTPSRDQLAPNTVTPGTVTTRGTATRKRVPPPVSSQAALHDVQPRNRNRSISRDTLRTPRKSSISSPESQTNAAATTTTADPQVFKQPPVPRLRPGRQPSGQSAQPAGQSLVQGDNGSNANDFDHDNDEQPFGYDLDSSTTVSQPSLSERTIETLSALPSSPAFKRRASNFFDGDASRRPQSQSRSRSRPSSRDSRSVSRPGSSYRSDDPNATIRSRPGSSLGQNNTNPFIASTHVPRVPPLPTVHSTPTRPISTSTPTLVTPRSSLVKMPSRPSLSATMGPGSPRISQPEIKNGSKSLAVRPLQSRTSANGLFRPSTGGRTSPEHTRSRPPRKNSFASANSSGEDRNPSSASTASTAVTVDSAEDVSASTSRKSSSALRAQIAKAKAAKRAASTQPSRAAAVTTIADAPEIPVVPTDPTFDFDLLDDPFGQKKFESSNRKVMQSRVETARTTGRLNISAMGLKEIPDVVLKMYDLESIGRSDGAWAESVDLARFVAADNELEMIEDAIFPDTDPSDLIDDDDDDGNGHQFAGLEFLDLHNNSLIALPMGLRRLHFLTSLNLVKPLRDLKLGYNLLYGAMDECLSKLENLEILDIQNNNVSALPTGLRNMSRLRILNLNENAFTSLPFESLSELPVTDLQARKNDLSGTLISHPSVNCLSHLQTLDVANNRLTIAAFPEGLADLGIRSIDLGSNDIRILPPEIARMNNLTMLRISGNPLREKKFSSLTTETLKTTLAARLQPPETDDTPDMEQSGSGFDEPGSIGGSKPATAGYEDAGGSRSDRDDLATPPTSASHSPGRTRMRASTASLQNWPIKTGGVLDRSNTQSSSLHPVVCSRMAADHDIREVRLEHNTFTIIPESLSFFGDTLTRLCMSHNQLVGENFFTGDELDLTALKELNLSSNRITSLVPLTSRLRAPNLEKLDVSLNRVVTLPVLREFFPSLTVLVAFDNHLEQLDFESIDGMKSVDVSNNDITYLNPRIGLLGGSGGLEKLDVKGNRFRVPRWSVIERGTEATLRWLRGRVPVAEVAEWRAKAGEAEEDENFNEFD